MVDDVVARIQAEDLMEIDARKRKQAETKVCSRCSGVKEVILWL